MPLSTVIDTNLACTLTAALDLATASAPIVVNNRITLPTGTATGQADVVWSDNRTVVASGTDPLDLAGTLVGNLGGVATFAKLKYLFIRAAAANVNNVRLNRPAANGVPLFLAVSDGLDILPGGVFLWVAPGAGVTVTPATADIINIDNSSSGTSVSYDVIIGGTSV